ncbi:hypothetical protein L596_026039 [Steinernema carpocapsae]|uniref:Uncharacterized protein n=1 Tax=Steinernema carpocapsae TaxID=34508 RepID=A0A4U5M0A1_STECR|nr:hypothetical protein L596_026039 [Steinernema carpocapsae]
MNNLVPSLLRLGYEVQYRYPPMPPLDVETDLGLVFPVGQKPKFDLVEFGNRFPNLDVKPDHPQLKRMDEVMQMDLKSMIEESKRKKPIPDALRHFLL